MWLRTQHELLKLLAGGEIFMSPGEVAAHFGQRDDKTARKWLANLGQLKLIEMDAQRVIVPTPPGLAISQAPFLNLPHLRVLWGVADVEGPATVGQIYADPLVPRSELSLREAREMGHVAKATVYRSGAFRAVYELTAKGRELIAVYEPIRRLRNPG